MLKFAKAALLGTVAGLASAHAASADIAPFTLTGYIEEFQLGDPAVPADGPITDPLAPARIRVSGIDVLLPRNMIIQMPGTYATAFDLFCKNPNYPVAGAIRSNADCETNGPPSESGLAIADTRKPPAAFEATLFGNIVDGRYIAGLAYISRELGATGDGYVKYIDNATGTLVVGKTPDPLPPTPTPTDPLAYPAGVNVVKIRLNDPLGRYGLAQTSLDIDGRFAVDDGNPTVHAATGYPLCVPRYSGADDPECPAVNRPTGMTQFVMDPHGTTGGSVQPLNPGVAPIPAVGGVDPTKQAPFVVGDFITYLGTLSLDRSGKQFIAAHTVEAPRLGIYTARDVPAYTAIEVGLIATFGPDIAAIPIENADRIKVVGFTTDPLEPIDVLAVDKGADGVETVRNLGTVGTRISRFGEFRLIVNKNAGVLQDPLSGATLGAPRELMVRVRPFRSTSERPSTLRNGSPVPEGPTAANGLVYGQYVAPMTEFIFPEVLTPGDPLPPMNFECLNFLVNGSGPLVTWGRGDTEPAGPPVGQLDPWPGAAAPASVTCGF